MLTRARDRDLPPLGRRARALFRVLFVAWLVVWTVSFAEESLVNLAHVIAVLALLSGLVWVVTEMRSGAREAGEGSSREE